MLPCVCSVIDHRWRQNVVKTKKWQTRRSRVCHWCSYHILTSSVIYHWTDTRQHGIYLISMYCLSYPQKGKVDNSVFPALFFFMSLTQTQTTNSTNQIIVFRRCTFFCPCHNLSSLFSGRDNVRIINNYWMRLSMISWIIKAEVCVICRSRRLRQITQTRGFDNSWYHAKTEFNNCFIILYFVSEENTPRGLVTRQTLNLTW